MEQLESQLGYLWAYEARTSKNNFVLSHHQEDVNIWVIHTNERRMVKDVKYNENAN